MELEPLIEFGIAGAYTLGILGLVLVWRLAMKPLFEWLGFGPQNWIG